MLEDRMVLREYTIIADDRQMMEKYRQEYTTMCGPLTELSLVQPYGPLKVILYEFTSSTMEASLTQSTSTAYTKQGWTEFLKSSTLAADS
jgi:hypothetical protein